MSRPNVAGPSFWPESVTSIIPKQNCLPGLQDYILFRAGTCRASPCCRLFIAASAGYHPDTDSGDDIPTPVPATKGSTEPGPADTLPPQWPLSITVEKSGMYSSTIIIHSDGGKGLVFVSRMDVRVTHPDGTVLTNGITKPKMGDTVEITGTSGTDRVEVMVQIASGETYKVIDQQMAYRGH